MNFPRLITRAAGLAERAACSSAVEAMKSVLASAEVYEGGADSFLPTSSMTPTAAATRRHASTRGGLVPSPGGWDGRRSLVVH